MNCDFTNGDDKIGEANVWENQDKLNLKARKDKISRSQV